MTGHLNHTDHARMDRAGIKPLSDEHGAVLLDGATRHGGHHLLAAELDTRTLAARPAQALPAVLRGLASGRFRLRPARR